MNTLKTSQNLLFLLSLVVGVLFGCQRPPDYKPEPFIWEESPLEYVDVENGFDTVRIHLAFQDGDANLGLDETDTLSPFNAFDVVRDANGRPVRFQTGDQFNIYTFTIMDVDNDDNDDTVRITRNLFRDNMLLDFIRINPLGEIIDTLKFESIGPIGTDNFNGRFQPLFKKDYSEEVYDGPLEGTITYQFISSFALISKGTTYRINARIVDRDLNISNAVLSSNSFTINP